MENKIQALGMDDSKVATRLLEKNYSPLLVRKYQMFGWPLWVAIIADCSLSDLDDVVYNIIDECKKNGMIQNDLQAIRNCCGALSQGIVDHYNTVKRGVTEGVYVLWAQDKTYCASAYGDAMVHNKCLWEIIQIINLTPHI